MAILDLLAGNNFISINVKVARGFGLDAAVYLAALLEINERASRKNTFDDRGMFPIDRKYLQMRTTLTVKEQLSIEDALCDFGLIEVDPRGAEEARISINLDVLTGLYLQDGEELKGDLTKLRQATSKKDAKREGNLTAVKKHIRGTYPDDLKQAYADWLEIVSAKFGFVSIKMLEDAEAQIEAYTRNVDLAIDVLRIAAAQGWKMISAAIDVSKKNQARVTTSNGVREVKDIQVMEGVEF